MKIIVTMAVLFIFIIIGAITNPDQSIHQEIIIEQYKKENPLTGLLFLGEAFSKTITYNNYILFSTTTIGKSRLTTGYLNNVVCRSMELDELKQSIKSNLMNKFQDSEPVKKQIESLKKD